MSSTACSARNKLGKVFGALILNVQKWLTGGSRSLEILNKPVAKLGNVACVYNSVDLIKSAISKIARYARCVHVAQVARSSRPAHLMAFVSSSPYRATRHATSMQLAYATQYALVPAQCEYTSPTHLAQPVLALADFACSSQPVRAVDSAHPTRVHLLHPARFAPVALPSRVVFRRVLYDARF